MTSNTKNERKELLQRAIRLKKASRPSAPELGQRPSGEQALLSEMQKSLWVAHQMEPNSPAYNLASAFRVQGSLAVPRLRKAWDEVASKHRLLRSTFGVEGDAILQIVHPPGRLRLGLEVLEVGENEGSEALARAAREPFDLEIGPLVRLRLIEERSHHERRFLLLMMHHILADERSLELLWQDVSAAYEGRPSELTRSVQYDDYVHWLLRREGTGRKNEIEIGLDYWRRKLDPAPNELELPFANPFSEAGARGRLLRRPLSLEVQQGVRRVAAATAASPFMVFAFAFRLLLQRYTAGERIALATPVSLRSHPATARMLGYFLNPVVISTFIDEAQPLEPAIREFSRELRESLAHASIPFQTVAEEVAPTRRSGRHPIFQSMFVYQETPPAPKLGNARLEPLVLDLGASKFDLSLFVTEAARSASPELAVEYRADRFDEAWMEKLLGHYETLLESLPEDLARNTADAPMLGEPELLELRRFAKGAELDTELSLGLLPNQILDQARRSPDSPAVISGGVSQSYAELVSSAGSIARKLSARGVKPGDRVGLFLNRSALMIAGILGSHWAGAAYVPLDPEYPRARNRDVLQDADVAAVLTTSSLKRHMPERSWATIDVGELDGSGDEPLDFDAAPVDLSPESPAYILYTSGSTGRPKGVVVTHHNLRASTAARLQYYGVAPQRFLLVPSISFDSSVAGLFWTLAVGGALVIPTEQEARDPERLAELIAEQRVMSLLCVPSLYAQLLGAGSAGTDMLAGLETAIVAGESCPPQLVEEHFRALPNARLLNEYGPTEATVWATVHEISREDLGRQVPIGRPIPGVRVDVLDALGRPVPAGIPGEAFIAGPTVTPGYWRRPELGDESFVTHTHRAGTSSTERRYRTGDRMAWTRDGRLLFMGRVDEQIKLRGFRIEPGEIEAVLTESREIERAAVVARPSGASPGTMQLIAFVETSTDGDDALDVDEWRPDLKQRLPDHMIPSRLVVVSELPRLPNGKVDREQLRDSVLEPDARTETCADVPSTLEQALISLWEGLLGHAGIGATDNFFELGGNSLLVVEMTRAIERDFSVKLSAADVFEVPTVRELASRIEQRGGPETPSYQHLYPIQPTGSGTTFIVAVPHFFTQTFAERFRGERPVYGLRGVGLRAEGNRGRWPTMSDLGEELVDEIRRRFPGDDGFLMAGYSFGASMAVEAVRLMEERGIPVRCLYLIAPMPVDFYRIGPFRVQLDGLRKPVEDLSITEALRHFARGNNPLTRRPYRRAWRWLAIQPWRRLMASVGKLRRRAGRQLTPRILHADVRVERFRLHARYRPGIIHTPTVIFNAKETETDAAATWRPYFRGPFTVHETPDPHLGEASADAASRVILRHLRDLDW